MENPVNVTVDVPALCTVIDFAALVVPTATAPKFSEVGEREIAVPTPLRATVCVGGLASSVKVKLPVRVPIAVGMKVTLTVSAGGMSKVIRISGAPDIYTVATEQPARDGTVTLRLSPGLQAYSFTFG